MTEENVTAELRAIQATIKALDEKIGTKVDALSEKVSGRFDRVTDQMTFNQTTTNTKIGLLEREIAENTGWLKSHDKAIEDLRDESIKAAKGAIDTALDVASQLRNTIIPDAIAAAVKELPSPGEWKVVRAVVIGACALILTAVVVALLANIGLHR